MCFVDFPSWVLRKAIEVKVIEDNATIWGFLCFILGS